MKCFISLALILCASEIASAEKPNIILVMADDQGWGDMAYNGHKILKTPNFDKAAKTGLRFDNFYAAAPVCSPTRASVLTGRHPNRMGVFKWGYPMRPQERTIAEVLQSAGYNTAHFGKWHLGSVRKQSPANPGNNGFQDWLSAPNFYDNDPILSKNGVAVQTKGESSIVAAAAANKWIEEKAKSGRPFLAVVWFGSPHSPHRAIEKDRALYDDQPKNMQHFLGEITGMDRAFGKIRDRIRELKIHENTILWYCSDNGALPKKGSTGGRRGFKGSVYQGGLLVPSIIEWPARIKKHRVTTFNANTCDIYPTLLDITGIKIQKQPVVDGTSLASLIINSESQSTARKKPMGFWDYTIKGIPQRSNALMKELKEAQSAGRELAAPIESRNAAKLPDKPMSADSFPGHSAWITGDWKLHRIEKKSNVKFELYNLKDDPSEKTDLSSSKKDRLSAMQKELDGWLKSVVKSYNGEDY